MVTEGNSEVASMERTLVVLKMVHGVGREKEVERGPRPAATNLGNLRHSTAQSWISPLKSTQ